MKTIAIKLFQDEAGFIVSAELMLISTIAVLPMVVGLSEVAQAVNQELKDVASAFGSINQSYRYAGAEGHQGEWSGSQFDDATDFCDGQHDIIATNPQPEGRGNNYTTTNNNW